FGEDNPQFLSQVLGSTPLARLMNTSDGLLRPGMAPLEKALLLGIGVKVSDVDLERAEAAEARAALNDELRGQAHIRCYTHWSPRAAQGQALTPEEVNLLRLSAEMEQDARRNALIYRAP